MIEYKVYTDLIITIIGVPIFLYLGYCLYKDWNKDEKSNNSPSDGGTLDSSSDCSGGDGS